MSVFHAPAHCASHSERGDQALARLVEQVNALRARPLSGEDFEAMERELHALFAEAEREVVGETLERLDVDLPYVEMEGQRYRRVLRSHATYTSAAGTVGVHRTLYRRGRERAVVPMELRAGIVAGHWTGLAARQASVVVAHVTPQEGETVFGELGGMRPSKSSLDRLPKDLGAQWEGRREAFEAALRGGSEVPEEAVTVAVSIDGVMVPMKDAKRPDGSGGYQEAGCGTLTFHDASGERLGTVYFGRMPQPHKAALKTTLGAELEAVLGKRPDLHVVTLADGAHDNWRFLDALAPQGTALVDFYHAAEQLKSGLDACYGEGNAKGRAQYEKLRHLLRHDLGGVEKVIRSLNHEAQETAGEQAYRRGVGILPQQPPPHGLCRSEGAASADWLGSGGGGVQDVGHPADEAFGDALAPCRGTGHPDATCTHSKQAVRFGMGVVVRDLSASSGDSRQRGAVSLSTGRLMDQFETFTRSSWSDLLGSISSRLPRWRPGVVTSGCDDCCAGKTSTHTSAAVHRAPASRRSGSSQKSCPGK